MARRGITAEGKTPARAAPPRGAEAHPALVDPWAAACGMGEGVVMAVLTGVTGPSYRNPGAALAIAADGRCAGAITSGCVEADLVLQADALRREGGVRLLRYGAGSPFFDLKLPCGGGIEVMLFALRDAEVLVRLARCRERRQRVSLLLNPGGRLTLGHGVGQSGPVPEGFRIAFPPPLRHVILGAGAEALVFARLVAGLGQEHLLLSHDEATLAGARGPGCRAAALRDLSELERAGIDAHTAVTLFYHDHDHEPALLGALLATPAFYIGAQGSRRAHQVRLERLAAMGFGARALGRVRGPIGLIPSTRDPHSLAVSVLAEITEAARTGLNAPAAGPANDLARTVRA